jgi:hypothetical protein
MMPDLGFSKIFIVISCTWGSFFFCTSHVRYFGKILSSKKGHVSEKKLKKGHVGMEQIT